MTKPEFQKIAFVGDYLPRKCGIATFTHDLRTAIVKASGAPCMVVPVNDIVAGYAYDKEVQFEIIEQQLEDYHAAADFLNFSNVDMVCLQHEFGIYGGPCGSHVLALLQDLRMPVVTTLHTVLSEPSQTQRAVMMQLIELSTRLVVMTERSRKTLVETYAVDIHKVDLIAHGIPTVPDTDQKVLKEQFNVEEKAVALTFGLLSPGKGIEHVLQAIPEIVSRFPNFIYLVLGATHPSLIREQGERYRISLERMAKELGITKHVSFYNRFVELEELTEFIGAADLYITPYLNVQQAVSGTLAYAFGCGQAVISTPYWHAEELLADGRGVLVPFADPPAIAREVIGLLADDDRRLAMRKQAHRLGRSMTWDHVSQSYLASFRQAREEHRSQRKPLAVRTLDEQPLALPQMQLGHLDRLSDSTGIVQHAIYTIPDHDHGYCTDDNARALILTVLLEELGKDSPVVHSLASRYAAFLNVAFNRDTARFRNFMSFDRCWLEDDGSDDSQGRALWALGTCVGRSHRGGMAAWASEIFQLALPACVATSSPRTWALGIIGIHEYLRRSGGDRSAAAMSQKLADRLLEMYDRVATDEWPWFEDIATYNNPKLSHALIVHGRRTADQRSIDIGVQSLRWLCKQQLSPQGRFRPIGSNGFSREGRKTAVFDQQAIEVHAMVSASIEAYAATKDPFWNEQAHLAFDWFLGRNDLGQPIYDASTGGCFDGLMEGQVNQNQGAESTLAFLLSLVEMRGLSATERFTSASSKQLSS
ncbi:GDP-mannose-dependent alpha-(1-6)-phosphatidylinositol monomannoside mannosyltransferase [Rubripirellula lacrimiformis]|uniref:GDP-mannose-dependent alpha-(1-6)-phosphatidylinositol monomannoside mannosyltransferase n=1 Tax=Rubripirellula lacrimiformis TaxID=1930273 RepID=A0A517NCN2_9BACT|nr:glycosyltransferase family 4 protein [Rubripirellula lacrimiformis]QDT04907.1 GDP-mannose-dependent alpha-(1-6)-phosphatidylinositol monomannoside mannosyltransferase [Rubripirellula lacrimiformis]